MRYSLSSVAQFSAQYPAISAIADELISNAIRQMNLGNAVEPEGRKFKVLFPCGVL